MSGFFSHSVINPCCQNQIPCWAEIIPSSDVQGIQLQAFDSGGESRIREARNRAESARFPVFSRLSANLTAETGQQAPACTTTQSHANRDFPWFDEYPRFCENRWPRDALLAS